MERKYTFQLFSDYVKKKYLDQYKLLCFWADCIVYKKNAAAAKRQHKIIMQKKKSIIKLQHLYILLFYSRVIKPFSPTSKYLLCTDNFELINTNTLLAFQAQTFKMNRCYLNNRLRCDIKTCFVYCLSSHFSTHCLE